MKKLSLTILILFYVFAGINHFIIPEFYIPLIPDYLPYPELFNQLSGFAEILFGVLLIFPRARTIAVYGIILMLIAFIPAHIFFILEGNCFEGFFCIPAAVSWFRLLIIHPLLIFWAWTIRNYNQPWI